MANKEYLKSELKYDLEQNCFIVDRKNYYDLKGKADATDEELLNYLLNIYTKLILFHSLFYTCYTSIKF